MGQQEQLTWGSTVPTSFLNRLINLESPENDCELVVLLVAQRQDRTMCGPPHKVHMEYAKPAQAGCRGWSVPESSSLSGRVHD